MLLTQRVLVSSVAILGAASTLALSASASTRLSPAYVAPSSSSIRSSAGTAPSTLGISPAATSVTAPSLPFCNGNEDQQAVWSSTTKKWMCRSIPKCTGPDQALHYDGQLWKCDTIGGLLMGYAAATYWPVAGKLVGTSTCDAGTSWGAGECKENAQNKNATLSCKPTTLKVEISTPSTDLGGNPITERRVFCYSRGIVVK